VIVDPHNTLLERVDRWIEDDPDPETRDSLARLRSTAASGDQRAVSELTEMFTGRLSFGTAGIRGPVGPGPRAMNRVVVSQTTAGLARFLLENRTPNSPSGYRVVVGCDARTKSDVFMTDTLEVLSGCGIEAIALPQRLPTPVLAFAIRALDADAAVMVTASHNPPRDNGYKVYLGGPDAGSQIIPPDDRLIEAAILDVVAGPFADIPRSRTRITPAPDEVVESYIRQTIAAVGPTPPGSTSLSVVYTPLHGVGAETLVQTLRAAGFPEPHVVEQQREPNPSFPTVAFPNPEEPGALDLAIALAKQVGADLIIANDPDADRLAIALPAPGGSYQALTGNQLGAIAGWRAAQRAQAAGQSGVLANSLVSSPILGRIAEHFGLDHEETLTGFKYVSRVPGLIYGFEEALGYLVTPSVVRDKDGISVALAMLDLAHDLAREQRTLWDYLTQIESAVGGFASSQVTIRLSGDPTQPSISDALRAAPPARIGHRAIARVDDFIDGYAAYPPENIIRYFLEDGSRVIVRPSGTEPKLKIYLDTAGKDRADAHSALSSLEGDVRQLVSDLGG